MKTLSRILGTLALTFVLIGLGFIVLAGITNFIESRPISWREAKQYVGHVKTVCGIIVFQASSRDLSPIPQALMIFGDTPNEPKESDAAHLHTADGVGDCMFRRIFLTSAHWNDM